MVGYLTGKVCANTVCFAYCYYAQAYAVCKAAGLTGLALAWYAAEPLCYAPCTPAWRSTVGQPRCYKALEPDAIHAPVLLLLG